MHRHQSALYHVETLCRLGSEHEAAVFLKAKAPLAVAAWQGELQQSTTSASASSMSPAEVVLQPSLFFSGDRRCKEILTTSTPQQQATLLRQLVRVNDATVLLLRHELEAARVILEDVVRTDRDIASAVRNLVYVYIKQGKSGEALALLKSIRLGVA